MDELWKSPPWMWKGGGESHLYATIRARQEAKNAPTDQPGRRAALSCRYRSRPLRQQVAHCLCVGRFDGCEDVQRRPSMGDGLRPVIGGVETDSQVA